MTTTPQVLDLPTVRRYARDLITGVGARFQYITDPSKGCTYTPDPKITNNEDPRKTTGCIVGEIAKRAGYDVEKMQERYPGPISAHSLQEYLGIDDKPEVVAYLSILQNAQDSACTWSGAYECAEIYAKSLETR